MMSLHMAVGGLPEEGSVAGAVVTGAAAGAAVVAGATGAAGGVPAPNLFLNSSSKNLTVGSSKFVSLTSLIGESLVEAKYCRIASNMTSAHLSLGKPKMPTK